MHIPPQEPTPQGGHFDVAFLSKYSVNPPLLDVLHTRVSYTQNTIAMYVLMYFPNFAFSSFPWVKNLDAIF